MDSGSRGFPGVQEFNKTNGKTILGKIAILPWGNIGFSFALACDLNGRPYPYCPGHISTVNIEISSNVALSHWHQGGIDFYGTPEN